MHHHKPYTSDSLMGRSGVAAPTKFQNTHNFLNRFNQLPSYSAIHSKGKLQKHHKLDASKIHQIKEKIPLNKLQLQLQGCKNKKSKRNIGTSEKQKSERRKLIIKALMDSKNSKLIQKLIPNSRKPTIQQRQTAPSTQQMFRNSKIKVNIERLSLKINYNYYPSHDLEFGQKKQQRFSFVPNTHGSDPILRLDPKQSVNEKQMTRSFAGLNYPIFDENQDIKTRYSKISSNILDSLKNSVVREERKDNIQIRMKSESKINRDKRLEDRKWNEINSESMKHFLTRSTHKNAPMEDEKLRKKMSTKSLKRFNVIRTQLKQSQKQNYPYNINLLPATKYITNMANTEDIYTLESRKDFERNIKENSNHFKGNLSLNPTSILHPEGDFAGYFESQFNPW